MSATEILEKVASATEPKTESVLEFVERLHGRRLKASELLKLPKPIRVQIVAEQFATAAQLYRDNPDLIVEDTEGPIDHD